MLVFNNIIKHSREIAATLLKGKALYSLKHSGVLSKDDSEYIIKNLTDEFFIVERKSLIKKIDREADFNKIKKQIIKHASKKPFWKYVVAAFFIGLVSKMFFFSENVLNISGLMHDIEQGSHKALLTLEDGSNLLLNKGAGYKTPNIQSNGTGISYTSAKNKEQDKKFHYLTVPRGGQFYLELSDGSEVWLNSDTKLKYPVTFIAGRNRTVELVYGEAYFKISPDTEHKGSRFRVQSKNQVIEVLGTTFNVKSYKDETVSYTTLIEGEVSLNLNEYTYKLKPGEQSKLDHITNKIQIYKINLFNEVSWKQGIFSFENKSLKDIMKVLARWYDMDVMYEDESIGETKFHGVLDKNQKIEDILNSIKNFKVFNSYEIENKTVILR